MRERRTKSSRYSLNQEMEIVQKVHCVSDAAIARRIGKSPRAVYNWRMRHHVYPTKRHLITSGEAARILGVTQQWIVKLAKARKLHARRTPLSFNNASGRRWWLFYPADVRRLADAAKR